MRVNIEKMESMIIETKLSTQPKQPKTKSNNRTKKQNTHQYKSTDNRIT